MKDLKNKQREIIAKLGGYELITNYPPNVWQSKKRKITNISFDKPKMYSLLMEIVDKLEQENNLSIEIKRYQCVIKKQYLNRHETLVNVDGETSKQKAIFEALYMLNSEL